MQIENFVAHRGWRQCYPENTLIAFREAILAGAVNIEMDIQLSADGKPWVFHDASLARLCEEEGLIWQYTSEQLRQFSAFEPLRLGRKFHGNPMCPLEDIVELLREFPGVNAYVELKEESLTEFGAPTMVEAVCQTLAGVEDRCVLISFELDAVLMAKQSGWQRCGAVFDYWPDWCLATLSDIAPEVVFIDRNIIPVDTELRSLPWPLLIYEVSTAVEAREWFERGAAAIETFNIGTLLEELHFAKASTGN